MRLIMITAMTVNGKIGRSNDEPSTAWTSKEDRKFFSEESKKHGVLIMGRTTYATIGRPLPERLNVVLTSRPDTFEPIPGVIEFTNDQPAALLQKLEARGFKAAVLAGGASVYAQFMNAGLITDLMLSIEPRVFAQGIDIFTGLQKDVTLELLDTKKLNPNVILLHYKFIYS